MDLSEPGLVRTGENEHCVMKIDRIELFHVEMPLIYPWRTAYGEDAAIHAVMCRLSSGSVDAWGESSPLASPCYSAEWGGGAFAVAREWLAPTLLGREIESGEALQQLLGHFKGNQFAKAAFDNAWWALESKLSNTPLHRLLGARRDTVAIGADFGVMDSIDQLLAAVGEAVDTGFPRVKLKFRPGWDIEMLAAVRRQHPQETFHIDCNSGYRKSDLKLFQQIDQFHLAMIEQPLPHDDLVDHAFLQKTIATPVCLDESLTSPRRAEQAMELQACGFANIKPGRVGGLTNAVAIHDICARSGIPCWVGGMLESATGSAHCIALAMLDNFTYPADIFPTARFYREDMSTPPVELEQDETGTPTVRAFEVLPEPDPQRLKALTVQHCEFKS